MNMKEIGKCGRDGEDACATLYYNASDISSNVQHFQEAMRQYCKLTSCRRAFPMKYFGFNALKELDHTCNNCAKKCSCPQCENRIL